MTDEKKYFMFVDESGHPSLKSLDKEYPIFVLCGVLFNEAEYSQFKDELNLLKLKYFNNKNIVFHSTKIRKRQKDFKILISPEIKTEFFNDLNLCIRQSNFTIVSVVVDKIKYAEEFGHINDLYEICLSVLTERTIHFLKENDLYGTLEIILERRGKREDNALKNQFNKILDSGTYHTSPSDIKSFNTGFHFRKKDQNINGLQLSDLVAYPIARQLLKPEEKHPSFEVFKDKFYFRGQENRGLKKIP